MAYYYYSHSIVLNWRAQGEDDLAFDKWLLIAEVSLLVIGIFLQNVELAGRVVRLDHRHGITAPLRSWWVVVEMRNTIFAKE